LLRKRYCKGGEKNRWEGNDWTTALVYFGPSGPAQRQHHQLVRVEPTTRCIMHTWMHSLIVQSAVEERTPPTLSLTGQQRLYYLPHQRASIDRRRQRQQH